MALARARAKWHRGTGSFGRRNGNETLKLGSPQSCSEGGTRGFAAHCGEDMNSRCHKVTNCQADNVQPRCPGGVPSLRPPSRFSATTKETRARHHNLPTALACTGTPMTSSMANSNVSILQPERLGIHHARRMAPVRLRLLTSPPAHSLLSSRDMSLCLGHEAAAAP